jgi:glycosyltransferase involved in cell wall biosynthesis
VLVSDFMKRRFMEAGFHEDQLDVIYRGVEFPIREDFDRERYGPPVFLIASRIALYKGIHFAIRAAAAFDKRAPEKEWEMWIAGHGDSLTMEYLSKLVASLGVGHRVKFIGKHTRNATYELMQRATAVISPSVFDEPFGNTNIEALASGTVLIASRSGAIEEIIQHGKSGLLYDRYNVQELAHHMELILDNRSMRMTLQSGGQERVRAMFTQKHIMRQVEQKLMDVAAIPIPNGVGQAEIVTLQ